MLPDLDAAALALPSARIQTEADLAHFLRSAGCEQYVAWLQQLAAKLVGSTLPGPSEAAARPSSDVRVPALLRAHSPGSSLCLRAATTTTCGEQAVRRLTALLTTLRQSISDHPPATSSQRYGNLAFRSWSAAMLPALPALVDAVVPASHKAFVPYLLPLLAETAPFGNATRLDYGTGHELAWFLFLFALRRIGVLEETDDQDVGLVVFPACVLAPSRLRAARALPPVQLRAAHTTTDVPHLLARAPSPTDRYLELVWALQDTYRLEPAGSHGVWGLDDFGFLPCVALAGLSLSRLI